LVALFRSMGMDFGQILSLRAGSNILFSPDCQD
jgi:hypothetical protein